MTHGSLAPPPHLLPLLLAAACTGPADTAGTGDTGPTGGVVDFDYPLDDTLRVNHIQAEGTHNSYHVEREGNVVEEWAYTHAPLEEQLACHGVRQFELDIHRQDDGTFLVHHVNSVDEETTCETFRDCLGELRQWSDLNPAHHPLFVMVEPKDSDPDDFEAWYADLEAAALDAWPEDRILSPDEVRGDHPDLRTAVTTDGWPTLGETRGSILFWIHEYDEWRAVYTHDETGLSGRLMFMKADESAPYAGIVVLDDPTASGDDIAEAVEAGFLVRTRADANGEEPRAGDTTRLEAAIESGAHMISTDYPAAVSGIDYAVEIPGGTPSACNPLTAPGECTSEDIENPAFLDDSGCP